MISSLVPALISAFKVRRGGGALHRGYPRPTQQAFFEAQEHAFEFFGGVFRRMRYDNLSLAVTKILRGYQREQTERFVAFAPIGDSTRSFCNPSRGNEKVRGGKRSRLLPAQLTDAGTGVFELG